MKLLLISLCVALAAADVSHVVPQGEAAAQIVRQELDANPDGSYSWAFETNNGISASANGVLQNAGSDYAATAVQGGASWTSPEGEKVDLTYTADENGYQVQGSHLPTPPPIPEYIIRALEFIRAHPPKEAN